MNDETINVPAVRGQDYIATVLGLDETRWERLKKFAELVATSGLFAGYNTAPKVLTVWSIADGFNLTPMQALRVFYPQVTKSGGVRLTMWADAAWGFWTEAGWQYDWKETSATRAAVEVWHPKKNPTHVFVEARIEEAEVAGIEGQYEAYPQDKLVAWAKRRAVRRTESGILMGLATAEEALLGMIPDMPAAQDKPAGPAPISTRTPAVTHETAKEVLLDSAARAGAAMVEEEDRRGMGSRPEPEPPPADPAPEIPYKKAGEKATTEKPAEKPTPQPRRKLRESPPLFDGKAKAEEL